MRTLNTESLGVQRNLSQLVSYGVTGQWQLAGNQLLQLGNQAGLAGRLFSGAGLAIGGVTLVVGGLTAALVSFMSLCTQASDEIEIEHQTDADGIGVCDLSFMAVTDDL